MPQLNTEQIVHKWKSITEGTMGLKGSDAEKAAMFAETYSEYEHANMVFTSEPTKFNVPFLSTNFDVQPRNLFSSLLPMNLQVIKKIKDLSKVTFVPFPVYERKYPVVENTYGIKVVRLCQETITTKTYQNKIGMNVSGACDIHGIPYGIDWLEILEQMITDTVSEMMNNSIEAGNDLYVYMPIADVFFIGRDPENYVEIKFTTRMFEKNENGINMSDI